MDASLFVYVLVTITKLMGARGAHFGAQTRITYRHSR